MAGTNTAPRTLPVSTPPAPLDLPEDGTSPAPGASSAAGPTAAFRAEARTQTYDEAVRSRTPEVALARLAPATALREYGSADLRGAAPVMTRKALAIAERCAGAARSSVDLRDPRAQGEGRHCIDRMSVLAARLARPTDDPAEFMNRHEELRAHERPLAGLESQVQASRAEEAEVLTSRERLAVGVKEGLVSASSAVACRRFGPAAAGAVGATLGAFDHAVTTAMLDGEVDRAGALREGLLDGASAVAACHIGGAIAPSPAPGAGMLESVKAIGLGQVAGAGVDAVRGAGEGAIRATGRGEPVTPSDLAAGAKEKLAERFGGARGTARTGTATAARLLRPK